METPYTTSTESNLHRSKRKTQVWQQSVDSQMDNQIWKLISDPFSNLFQFLSKFSRKRFFEMSSSLLKKIGFQDTSSKGQERWKEPLRFRRAPRAMEFSVPCDEEIMPLTLWVQDSWVLRKDRLDDTHDTKNWDPWRPHYHGRCFHHNAPSASKIMNFRKIKVIYHRNMT